MLQSYTYTPNPVVYGFTFNLTFTDNTRTISNNTYNLTNASSNVLASFNNTDRVFSPIAYTSNSLVFDSSGNLYVACYDNRRIIKISSNGSTTTTLITTTFANSPYCLAFYNNFLYYSNAVKVFKVSTSGVVTSFTSNFSNTGVIGLAFDTNGYLYAIDTGDYLVYKISPDGLTITTIISTNLLFPTSIAINSNNNIYCSNRAGPIQIFNSSGTYINSLSITGDIWAICFDNNNNLYCSLIDNQSNVCIYKFLNGQGSPVLFAVINNIFNDLNYGLTFDTQNNFYLYSALNSNIYTYATTQLPFTNATSNTLTNNSINNLSIKYGSSTLNTSNISVNVGTVPCFLKGTNILTDKGYIPIENLKKGDLIQTFKNGFVPIFLIGNFLIGNKEINNNDTVESPLYRLYKYTNELYPELFDDLIVTGGHSILVDEFTSEKQQIDNDNLFSCTTPLVDGKHRLLSCNNEKAVLYEKEGIFTVYHLALENESEFGEYGIFANGLLTESCSIDFLKKCMNFS